MLTAIALDLGTTSIKAGLLDDTGTLRGMVAAAAPEMVAGGGRYESDALAYAQTAERVLAECLAQVDGAIPPLGMCCQRSSFLIWERTSGQPITPLISWQDTRGAASCEALQNFEVLIQQLTGLRLTPYYFAPKLRVLLQQHPEWRAQLESGEYLVGTLDALLIWRWTGLHVTEASMAARTLLMDIHQLCWSPQLCELFDIPISILPEIRSSAGMSLRLGNGLTLQACMGDQSAALIASVDTNGSEVLVNLGTGGFVVRYAEEGVAAPASYLRTLVYQDAHTHMAVEGTLNSLAAALAPYPVAECRSADLGRGDIFCTAEPSGLGAPYFRNDIGIQFSSSVEHLTHQQMACLLLEGIVFRVARILGDFQRASPVSHIYLAGGLSELECLQQGIAQCAPCAVYRLQQKDASLQGAAMLAAGMKVVNRDAEIVAVEHGAHVLPEKYRRWKVWFDALLKMPLP